MADSRNIQSLFVTKLYRAELPRAASLNAALASTCLSIADEDKAGRRWAKEHGYKGYTSYASLDDLPTRASVFAELVAHLNGHARGFAKALDYELGRRRIVLDSLWINVMDKGAVHTPHIGEPLLPASHLCFLSRPIMFIDRSFAPLVSVSAD